MSGRDPKSATTTPAGYCGTPNQLCDDEDETRIKCQDCGLPLLTCLEFEEAIVNVFRLENPMDWTALGTRIGEALCKEFKPTNKVRGGVGVVVPTKADIYELSSAKLIKLAGIVSPLLRRIIIIQKDKASIPQTCTAQEFEELIRAIHVSSTTCFPLGVPYEIVWALFSSFRDWLQPLYLVRIVAKPVVFTECQVGVYQFERAREGVVKATEATDDFMYSHVQYRDVDVADGEGGDVDYRLWPKIAAIVNRFPPILELFLISPLALLVVDYLVGELVRRRSKHCVLSLSNHSVL